jgi:hypothetical protein
MTNETGDMENKDAPEPGPAEPPAEPQPSAQPAPAKAKPGNPDDALYARAFDRLAAASTPPPRRGGYILLILLVLVAAGGFALWRMGRLDPVLADIGAGIERVAPMTGPLKPTLERVATALQGGKPAGSEAEMLVETKKLLTQLDFQPGPPDGTLDDQTVAAIQAYQQMAGLPVDGKPSEALLEDLRSVVADQTKPQSQPASN